MRSNASTHARLWFRLSGWAHRVIDCLPKTFDSLAPDTSRWLPPF
jgi:hypothetical protein